MCVSCREARSFSRAVNWCAAKSGVMKKAQSKDGNQQVPSISEFQQELDTMRDRLEACEARC